MLDKLKKRYDVKSNFQLLVIFIVFAVTGSSTLYVRKGIFYLLGITNETNLLLRIILYVLIILPVYNLLLLIVGFLFGQFKFFWEFEKKFISRIKLKNRIKKVLALLVLLIITNFAMGKELEKVTLGGGCFWCTEAVYLELKGVVDVKPGYSGGHVKNPSYNEVCAETTGHAEVVQLTYDSDIVNFAEILEVFFITHNPTTLNQQGNDIGTQYRSAVFYHSEKQKQIAEKVIQLFEKEKVYNDSIVTEVVKLDKFYLAEEYHINYFAKNKNQAYCQLIVVPKLEKFRKIFKDKLR